ncbi:MAG: sulfatase-like hydrolase/transferase [Clostridia bacterium]|nr:sulfatase-like hydrolase/transferase [Clostridia bacterium]
MKKMIPAFLVALISGFMFFIYEPLTMYATNVNDFWFDIYIMIKPSLLFFCLYFISVSVFFLIIYLANKHFSEKLHIYKGFIIASIIAMIILYIQGNFLIGGLPSLDGTEIDWNTYTKEIIISIIMMIIVSGIVIFTTLKFKYDKVIKVFSFILCAILFMLSTSLISVMTREGVMNKKERVVALTTDNLNNASINSNFYILLVDAVDSSVFEKVMNNSDYGNTFEDFTYYPDTMSVYRFTRDTIPYIFSSGKLNRNETNFEEYYNSSFNNSTLLKELDSNGYMINFYEPNFGWNDKESDIIDNLKVLNRSIDSVQYFKEVVKYDLFKYLPYPLKRYSHVENMDFSNCQVLEEAERFSWDDKDYYENLIKTDIKKIDDKNFSFIHIEGAHVPLNYDEDLNKVEGGTYEQKVGASLHIIDNFIDRLRENDVYDNSVIIIMSDHGYGFAEGEGRQNPILFIKGVNEHHEMIRSDKPVSFTDFNEIYKDLINGKTSENLLENVDYNRVRPFLWYEYNDEDHMIEYEQRGYAGDEETLVPTGKEYNR